MKRGFIGYIALFLLSLVAIGILVVWVVPAAQPNSHKTDVATTSATSTDSTPSTGFAPYQSGVEGRIMLGPTCPVERMPPDPKCADKPYQTLVAIFRPSDLVHAVVLTQSSASGNYKASLPPGEYVVGAGEKNVPRCPTTSIIVAAQGYTRADILCDTGIR